jgi:phosphate-selective porin OprO and OprP
MRAATLVLLVFVIAAVPAAAQNAPQPPAGTPPPPTGTAPAFVVQSDNGDNRLQLGAIVQADARFALDDDQHDVLDTFTVRRFRAVAQGRVARYFDFFLNTDFAGGVVNVRDAYVDTLFSPAFRVRLGKFKAPFSYDRNILIVNILFIERGLTAAVAPDRDTGVQLFGDLAGGRVSYAASLTNGVVDGGSSDVDGNESKDVTGRLVVKPWTRTAAHPLSGLGVAFAANTGVQGAALPSFLTSGRQPFFSYAAATADGRRTRWSPQTFYYRGPFGGYAEYVRSRGGVAKNGVTGDVDHDAWQVVGSWVLTGETAPPERNVRPRVNFDPPSGHYGALQLVGRVQKLEVSRDAFARGLTSATASRTADVWAVGLNWYFNPFVKWQVNVERTVFDGGASGPRRAETMLLGRAQLAF